MKYTRTTLLSETLISLSAAAEYVPRDPDEPPPTPVCMWRWAKKGIKSSSGNRVRLEVVKVGRRLMTSPEALHRFFYACAE